MSPPRNRTRVEREVEINAPAPVVWKALTDARELVRWFPLEASVTPGSAGRIWRSWKSGPESVEAIEIWEPERHLRTRGIGGSWAGIATDYHLEGRGGRTVLRVVSSGFQGGDDWGDLHEAFGNGWDFELRGLRHYLEHHRGSDRVIASVSVPGGRTLAETWSRLVGPGKWLAWSGAIPEVGSRFTAETAAGDTLTGEWLVWSPPLQLVASIDQWNLALLRIHQWGRDGAGEAWIWLSTYGTSPPELKALELRWAGSLAGPFPAGR